jgi:putative nucleotidyltransferase with HDIG domain
MDIDSILKGDDPILETFKGIAPGSDRHCINVSLLCEAVCKVIDNINVNNLIAAARVHDIGKCNNPSYFSENQDETNIHDELDPLVSYQYISRHVADGVLKLVQLEIPCEIIKIVSEHHGDSVISAIYSKAKTSRKKGKGSDPEFYRYKSSKPTSIESCILMICDVVESATRSLYNAGKLDDAKSIIDNLINKLIDDEQIDILTLGHIRVIKKILLKEVESIYHKRVDYEDEEDELSNE